MMPDFSVLLNHQASKLTNGATMLVVLSIINVPPSIWVIWLDVGSSLKNSRRGAFLRRGTQWLGLLLALAMGFVGATVLTYSKNQPLPGRLILAATVLLFVSSLVSINMGVYYLKEAYFYLKRVKTFLNRPHFRNAGVCVFALLGSVAIGAGLVQLAEFIRILAL